MTITARIGKLKGWAKIKNQQIKHILITPTFTCAMLCYLVFVIILGGLGVLLLMMAMKNHDMLIRYDDQCKGIVDAPCAITFTPTQTLVAPKMYYKLDNFYANHRNFVKSRNYKQLRGIIQTAD